jgi:hypothetical protein
MYSLKNNEILTPAMFYTADSLYHGQVVTTEIVRVNIWLRSDSAPKYVHLLNAQQISLTGVGQSLKFNEVFVPTSKIIAYHVAPNVEIELDYLENEPNRHMVPTIVVSPSLLTIQGDSRISTQTDFGTTLEVGRSTWLSLYKATISTPKVPKMSVQTEMVLIRPNDFAFAPQA